MSTPTADEVRAEVEAWLDDNWDPALTVREWWSKLFPTGYTHPMLPENAYGKGWGRDLAAAVMATMADRGVMGPPSSGLGYMLAAPTIAAHGSQEQIDQFLPEILDGTVGWCQLFSEPGAGSDLASLGCKAERDGDEWIITGQKVWTSGGQVADWGMLIARTNPDAPKHKGISWFAFDMNQPGVTVRPLMEMTGRALFNEVFIDEARVPDDNIIGGLNNGWAVANSTLMFERASLGSAGKKPNTATPGVKGAALERPVTDFTDKIRGEGGGPRIGNQPVEEPGRHRPQIGPDRRPRPTPAARASLQPDRDQPVFDAACQGSQPAVGRGGKHRQVDHERNFSDSSVRSEST